MAAIPVLVLLGSTDWEGPLVAGLAHPASGIVIARRCLDTADLLAAAAAGLGRAVVLGADAPRLDADVIDRVHRTGMAVVGVVTSGDDDAAALLHRWRVEVVVHVDVADLGGAVRETATALEACLGVPHGSGVREPALQPSGDGQVVTVWGPPGAPGRTTVALALADEAARAGHDVLLIDADTWAPSVTITLGVVDDGAGLASACRRALAGALDVTSLAGLAREVRPGLRVLPGLPRAGRWTEVRATALADVLACARELSALVVVDVAAPLEQDEELVFDTDAPRRNAATLAALECADVVLAVGTCDPAGLVRLVSGLSDLHDAVPGLDPRVVVTRVRESVVGRRPDAAIADALHRHAGIVHPTCIPDDREAFDSALRTGRTLAESAPSSRARAALRSLTTDVLRELGLVRVVVPMAR